MSQTATEAVEPERPGPRSAEQRFAVLTSSLLARKGEAEPAMEPFSHARVAESARQMRAGETHAIGRKPPLETGEIEPAGVADQSEPSGEHRISERRAPAARSAGPARAPSGPHCAPPPSNGQTQRRAAVTFRMTIHDFLRLQLAAAELERPAQDIVNDALQGFLDSRGVERLADCRCLKAAGDACEARAFPPRRAAGE
jgi:hypothetical protein